MYLSIQLNGTYKSTVVVQTNNLGIPGLVTSMDQIYEVSCDYSTLLGGKIRAGANLNVMYVALLSSTVNHDFVQRSRGGADPTARQDRARQSGVDADGQCERRAFACSPGTALISDDQGELCL